MIQPVSSSRVNKPKVEVYETCGDMGEAAATAAAKQVRALARQHSEVAVIFATGESQLATLRALTAMPDIPWKQVVGFHMDEYLGITNSHRASFRRYLRENLVSRVPMKQFYEIDGAMENAEATCQKYAELLRSYEPQLCLLGIGENGHLAFNDPAEANFEDPVDVKIVSLDQVCRQQQVNEGWFETLDQVPRQAITLTIPALLRAPELILSVPGPRKARIVRRTLHEAISPACPATILRTHPNALLFLDTDSAAALSA